MKNLWPSACGNTWRQRPSISSNDLRSSGVASSCDVLGGDAVALGEQPLLRPVEARALVDLRDVARDRREREPQVIDPRAMVVVEAVARRHEEPRVLARLELGDPGFPGVALLELGQHLGGCPAIGERGVDALRDRRTRKRLELVVGTEHRRVVARDHLRHHLRPHVGERRWQNWKNVRYAP